MNWTGWRKFRPFTDCFEINHFVGHPGGRKSKWETTLEGKNGSLSQNEGCQPKQGSEFDYKKLNDQKPIKSAAVGVYFIRINGCTEHESGYFDYIGLSNSQPDKGKNNSTDHGIYNRLYDHYRKIVGLPKRGDLGLYFNKDWKKLKEEDKDKIRNDFANKEFKDYQDLRSYLEDLSGERYRKGSTERFLELSQLLAPKLNTIVSIKSFFESEVKLSFNTYISPTENKSTNEVQIAKGEGLALQAYKHRYNAYPFLNEREEGKAVVDFESLFASD